MKKMKTDKLSIFQTAPMQTGARSRRTATSTTPYGTSLSTSRAILRKTISAMRRAVFYLLWKLKANNQSDQWRLSIVSEQLEKQCRCVGGTSSGPRPAKDGNGGHCMGKLVCDQCHTAFALPIEDRTTMKIPLLWLRRLHAVKDDRVDVQRPYVMPQEDLPQPPIDDMTVQTMDDSFYKCLCCFKVYPTKQLAECCYKNHLNHDYTIG